MGIWSSISSFISGMTEKPEVDLRKEHGFKGFYEEMNALKNFDPEVELNKALQVEKLLDPDMRMKVTK